MSKKLSILLYLMVFILLAACSTADKKPNPTIPKKAALPVTQKTSVVSLNDTNGKFHSFDTSMLPDGAIPLTKSPAGNEIYYMERTDKGEKQDGERPVIKALKGDTYQKVNLLKLDAATGSKTAIANGIPYISFSKWNNKGTVVAFCGGERLTVYDTTKKKLLLSNELKNDSVTYFGWSPDGDTIYTEHPSLINGAICSFTDGKILHCYETDIRFYYKGDYKDGLYFASEALKIDEDKLKQSGGKLDENRTVIADSSGKVIKDLPCGRFRDSYKDSILQIGESGFGLYYFGKLDGADAKELTREYIYDTKFIAGGYFIYTIKSEDVEKNAFYLYIADDKGNDKAKVSVSGPYVSISPDGKTGYISGQLKEAVDFQKLLNNLEAETKKYASEVSDIYDGESEKLFNTIRGAVDTYLKFDIAGIKDYDAAKKYFIDTENPPQVAYFDITTIFNERNGYSLNSDFYENTFYLSKLSVKDDRASVVVESLCRNSMGSAGRFGKALELVKKDGSWYVTGFSTFPDSKKAKDLKLKVEKIVKDAKEGKLFEGKFKGADIEIGQIQFWQMSEPTLSSNIDHSNYCKVYLKVMEGGKEVIYKIVLSKERSWEPGLPTRVGLSWL